MNQVMLNLEEKFDNGRECGVISAELLENRQASGHTI